MSLESQLQALSTDPLIQDFISGAQVRTTRRVQKFLAPIVPSPDVSGRYRQHTVDSRLIVPSTIRSLGGRAVQVAAGFTSNQFTCTVNAIDYPLDAVFAINPDNFQVLVEDAVTMLADVESQASEREAIGVAVAAAGAGTSVLREKFLT